jgi:hypothetical protein
VEEARRILVWQAVMGVSIIVVHGAYNSLEGLRLTEAPPDFGPASPRWEGMQKVSSEASEIQRLVAGKRQVAPVAILWPIRTFCALGKESYSQQSPLRDEFVDFVRQCLDRQVGIQFLDEEAMRRAEIREGRLRIGLASYSHVVLCAARIIRADTLTQLRRAHEAGVRVLCVGTRPAWQQTAAGLDRNPPEWCPVLPAARIVESLPRLAQVAPDGSDIRCTAWADESGVTRLLLNLSGEPRKLSVDGQPLQLGPDICTSRRLPPA